MRLTKREREAQAVLPLPIELQPEPVSFCADQPKWERREIHQRWLEKSEHRKACEYRAVRDSMRAYWAQFTPEIVEAAWKQHEAEQYQRKVEAGLVVDCPPSDAVAFWYDTRFGIDRSRSMRLGRWVNQVQLDGLLKRGMSNEFLELVPALPSTRHQARPRYQPRQRAY
jgi:hypothetical protein